MIDMDNISNKPASIGRYGYRDLVGITMSKDKLSYFKLLDSNLFAGMFCSVNDIPGMVRPTTPTIECSTVVRGNDKL